MKKTGILNSQLSRIIASMGHGDSILIGDAGMPIPQGVELVDLSLCQGVPGFLKTLEVVLLELEVEEAFIASEMEGKSKEILDEMEELIQEEFPLVEISHEDLKKKSASCKAAIRTGEFTPYSNIILKSGVVF